MILPDVTAAADCLRERARQHALPIDLVAITNQFPSLRIREVELDGEGLFVDLASRGAEIYLRQDAGVFRKRFTLAHELGHLVLSESGGHPVGYRHSKKIKNAIENWCNAFAANLLMPKDQVLHFLREAKLSGLVEALSAGPRAFQVSHQAFRMRAVEVAPLSIYVLDASAPTCKLKEFFLCNSREDLRWTASMNSIVAPMLGHAKSRSHIAHTDQTIIVAGYPKATARKSEFLAIILPQRAQ
jgi:Zn-dependent peptidase ImmA (M78 family)